MPDANVDAAQVRLVPALRARGDAPRAEREKAYQKSRWGHWGVSLPEMDAAIKEPLGDLTQDEALSLCRRLWREPVRDLKIVAGRILARKMIEPDEGVVTSASPTSMDGRSRTIWRRLLALPHRGPRTAQLCRSKATLWTRPAALVFTLPSGERDPERMLIWAARLADRREWFIQKAVGWWLRELSKRDLDASGGF